MKVKLCSSFFSYNRCLDTIKRYCQKEKEKKNQSIVQYQSSLPLWFDAHWLAARGEGPS
jgi:hypothetical protein